MSCLNLKTFTQAQYTPVFNKIPKKDVKSYGIVEHGDIPYSITGRGYDVLQRTTYPPEYLADLTPDMRILDVGTGDGSFVEDLRNRGFTGAEGIDIGDALPDDKPYLKQVAIEDADYPDNTFDRIFSSYSIFCYPEPQSFQKAALEKMARILKPGGKIRLAPLRSAEELKALVREVPALAVTDEGAGDRCIELKKVVAKPVNSEIKKAIDIRA
jgi:SAM-dependent methyltransferase